MTNDEKYTACEIIPYALFKNSQLSTNCIHFLADGLFTYKQYLEQKENKHPLDEFPLCPDDLVENVNIENTQNDWPFVCSHCNKKIKYQEFVKLHNPFHGIHKDHMEEYFNK